MRSALFSAILTGTAFLSLSCGSTGPGTGDDPSAKVEVSPGSDALPADHPPLDASLLPMESAKVRRLSVKQLRNIVPTTMGKDVNGNDIVWMLYSYPGFEKLADVLGEADYANRTDDNLEISPLYVKFMDVAARDVCGKALDADLTKSDKSTRVLMRYVEPADTAATNPEGVDQNLRYLKLRMHGIKVAPDDTESITELRTLFTDVTNTASADPPATEGWRVVCVALFTAPEFSIY